MKFLVDVRGELEKRLNALKINAKNAGVVITNNDIVVDGITQQERKLKLQKDIKKA